MKTGSASSGGRWFVVRVLVRVGEVEQRSCLYGLLAREDQAKLDASLRAHVQKRAVRPPDEKRRLGERRVGFGSACARSRAPTDGRCQPERSWRRAACPAGAWCAGSALSRRDGEEHASSPRAAPSAGTSARAWSADRGDRTRPTG